MAKLQSKILGFLVILLTVISVNQWSSLPVGNTTTSWIIYLTIFILLLILNKRINYNKKDDTLLYLKIYVYWVIICILRGVFVADNYWDYKSLITNSFGLLIIISVYTFRNIFLVQYILQNWIKFALPIFLIIFFFTDTIAYGYYLIPISFLLLFFPVLPQKWKLLVFGISVFVVLIDLSARSNVIKFFVPFIFSFIFYFKGLIRLKLLNLTYILLFALPFVFFSLAATSNFNIFNMDEYIEGEYFQTKIIDGEITKEKLKADTRTFLYKEVIFSAIKNNYVMFGVTPASGNDSDWFGYQVAEELKTRRFIRYKNEVSILNVFTWTGIVGVVLYFLVFFRAVKLSIFQSNNTFSKILGLYVSFRWLYAWVEDFNNFDIMNLMLWITVSLCYSHQFRNMTDGAVIKWIQALFSPKNHVSYPL